VNGLGPHLFFFTVLAAVIVVMGSFYSEPEDGPALRSVPRRLAVFLVSCAGVAAVVLVCEHVFASVT
jgi:hypothetical protein